MSHPETLTNPSQASFPDAQDDSRLRADAITIGYESRTISTDLSIEIPEGKVTVIIGPNACGKSTLLRSLSRLLKPEAGRVLLDGKDIHSLKSKEVARRLGLLPQSSIAPYGICVADLVARGRFPHQNMLQQWSRDDEQAVARALAATNITELADRSVDELSGGQRQRVWLSVVLAQETDLMLLDEPTTFLDISHQYEVLELCRTLNRERGHTLVMVLHDLNQACRYADHIVAMKNGEIVVVGNPREVITPKLLQEVFGLEAMIIDDPVTGTPLVIPIQTQLKNGESSDEADSAEPGASGVWSYGEAWRR